MHNLACYTEAEEMELRVLKLRRIVLGEAYLALTYDGQKHYKEGEEMGMRVMELQKKLFGEE